MNLFNVFKFIQKNSFLFLFIIFTLISSCSVPKFLKPSKVSENTPVNAQERARQNIKEGKGLSFKDVTGASRGSTNYEFSTSNPLWRATLGLIDFMPLATVDYSGGIIITDWYNDSQNINESIKITIRFLSNTVETNSLKIIVHNKKCKTNEVCAIKEINSKINYELQKSILNKAAALEIESKTKKK